MTERKARARTGESGFLAGLGMTISFRNCQRKARATAEAATPAAATTEVATTAEEAAMAEEAATAEAAAVTVTAVNDRG